MKVCKKNHPPEKKRGGDDLKQTGLKERVGAFDNWHWLNVFILVIIRSGDVRDVTVCFTVVVANWIMQ